MAFSLFGNNNNKEEPQEEALQVKHQVVLVPTSSIVANRFQPRQVFDERGIRELAETIRDHGLLQPIVLREFDEDQYEIIAGERRFRAINTLHWKEVPAIIQTMSDDETASLALIENLQREGLSPIEEAQAYQALMKLNQLTQSQLAEEVGKSQSFIANKLRLLKLTAPVQEAMMRQDISERHGRALLAVTDNQQAKLLERIISDHLTVKDAERLIQRSKVKPPAKPKAKSVSADTRVALNTIRQSIKMVTDAGMNIQTEEHDEADHYRIIIDILKDEKE